MSFLSGSQTGKRSSVNDTPGRADTPRSMPHLLAAPPGYEIWQRGKLAVDLLVVICVFIVLSLPGGYRLLKGRPRAEKYEIMRLARSGEQIVDPDFLEPTRSFVEATLWAHGLRRWRASRWIVLIWAGWNYLYPAAVFVSRGEWLKLSVSLCGFALIGVGAIAAMTWHRRRLERTAKANGWSPRPLVPAA